AAVSVSFARFSGVLFPSISETNYLVEPIRYGSYAVSLSTAQLVGVSMIALLTATNMLGLKYGKWIQNLFTVAKTGALIALIVLALVVGWNASAVNDNFGNFWTVRSPSDIVPGLTAATAFGLFIALIVSQTGSLFSAD